MSEISPTGELTKYEYDSAGRLISTELLSSTREKGKKTCYIYDDLNRLIEEKDGPVSKKFQYDALNRVISETLEDVNGVILDWKTISYDVEGNPSKTCVSIDGKNADTKVFYYPGGIPKRIVDAEGNITTVDIDYFFKNSHNQLVVKKKTINPKGVVLEEIFNTRGFLANSRTTDPYGKIISKKRFVYDLSGNITEIIDSVISKDDEKDVTTKFTYGPGSQLLALTEEASNNEERKTYFEYNKIGQKNKVIYEDGTIVSFEFDHNGRLERQKDLNNFIDYSYSYDSSDRLISAKNNITKKSTIRSYNCFGDLSEEILESGLSTSYSYNKDGFLEYITLPDQSKIGYGYKSSQLKSISRISSSGKSLYSHEILERDQSSNVISQRFAAKCGEFTSHYDLLGRVTKRNHSHFKESIPKSGYDSTGNLVAISVTDPIGKKDHSFAYDYLSQLIKEDGVKSHIFSYDSLNNRLTQDDIKYQVNNLNQVLKASSVKYVYDQNGRRTQKIDASRKTSYSYDVFDRLISLDVDTVHVEYEYDAFHRRISKSCFYNDGSTYKLVDKECYLYIDDDEIGVVNSKGVITELRLLGEGLGAEIGASIACELYGELYIPISDHRGNIAVMLSKEGKVAESYRYSAFGEEEIYDENNERQEASKIRNPWRFSSKRVDDESGLVYYGRRYYDAELGKWLTCDPLGLKAGPNLYAFVLNDPLTHIDLYGLEGELTSGSAVQGSREQDRNVTSTPCDSLINSSQSSERITAPTDTRSNASSGGFFSNICSGFKSVVGGVTSGVTRFCSDAVFFVPSLMGHSVDFATGLVPGCRTQIGHNIDQFHNRVVRNVDGLIAGVLSIDTASSIFQYSRSVTTGALLGIGASSLLRSVCVLGSRGFKYIGSSIKSEIFVVQSAKSYNQGKLLKEHLRQLEAYGMCGARKLQNNRIRYYGEIDPPRTPGEMIGRRVVREWNPKTDFKRTWHETLDGNNNVRRVRPQRDDKIKIHYQFDSLGNYIGRN